jgi:hypothetical protein
VCPGLQMFFPHLPFPRPRRRRTQSFAITQKLAE